MPLRETAYQGASFLALVYVGAAAAILCDLAAPALNSRSFLAHLIADCALCGVVAAFCLAALAMTGCGEARLYMALALALGAAVYRLGVRRLFLSMIKILRRNRSLQNHSE